MSKYYLTQEKTTANSSEFLLSEESHQRFPVDGFFIGTLRNKDVEIPALVDFKVIRGVGFLYNSDETRKTANNCIERLLWRIACSIPSKLCSFLIYNGESLGEAFNFTSLLDKRLLHNGTIFNPATENKFSSSIDEIIAEITKRTLEIGLEGKKNLVELNEHKGDKAEKKYHFVFISDFPEHLSQETMLKVSQLAKIGNKVGIHIVMTWNTNASIGNDKYSNAKFDPKELIQNLMLVYPGNNRFFFKNSGHDDILNRFNLTLDDKYVGVQEAYSWANYINTQVEKSYSLKKSNVINQDFEGLSKEPYPEECQELSVTVGLDLVRRSNVTLRFNSKDYIHAFILGQSGSGKSVLLNNIITSAILKYSPDDLVLYLMDFKGVEFNRYKGIKHTKAVLVDNSDPQMTLEVLRELKEENRKRTIKWREVGVSNIDGYNAKNPQQKVPQILFVADECQVMFKSLTTNSTSMQIQREISDILNIIATQGRSQGIHMLLATQQLDETDISGQILKNLTECFLLMSAPSDSNRLVPDSSDMTAKQQTGVACYYHKKELQNQVQTFYAPDEDLEHAISLSQQKAKNYKSNGAAYFCGSSIFQFEEKDKAELERVTISKPISFVGKNIGINGDFTKIVLKKDFSENILIWGVNKEEQATGVLMNAIVSLMYSYRKLNYPCDFLVIDCYANESGKYKAVLNNLEEKGMCHVIERKNSGRTLSAIAEDIKQGCAQPVVLAIIGSERFIEMKRNLPLQKEQTGDTIDSQQLEDSFQALDFSVDFEDISSFSSVSKMSYQQALTYILEEGPNQGVHTLLQVDKPSNILFKGDYDTNATEKFRHKIILHSENKYLLPMRFSHEIDVEILSEEEEHLRAYYYPEDGTPILFTPYTMPDINQ